MMPAPTTTRVNSSSFIKNGSVVHGDDSSNRRIVGESYQYIENGLPSTSYQQPPVMPLVTHNHPKNEIRRGYQQIQPPSSSNLPSRSPQPPPRTYQPLLIATISAGFDKGDYLIREERGANVYFDFFEEAYNYACQKGFTRLPKHEEKEYMSIIRRAHKTVPGGIRYNTGRLLMVLHKKLVPLKKLPVEEEDSEPSGRILEGSSSSCMKSSSTTTDDSNDNNRTNRSEGGGKKNKTKKLKRSTNTLPTDSESDVSSHVYSSRASTSCSTSYVDSWE